MRRIKKHSVKVHPKRRLRENSTRRRLQQKAAQGLSEAAPVAFVIISLVRQEKKSAGKILGDYFSFSAEKTVRPGRPLPRASSGQARPEPFSAADQNKKPKELKPPLWLLR